MKRVLISVLALITTSLLILGCGSGSGPQSLTVAPASANIWTNYETGQYHDVVLTATLSNGGMPADLQWTTSDACVAPGNYIQNTATIVCNFTCGGSATATIKATSQGLTGTASIHCTWE